MAGAPHDGRLHRGVVPVGSVPAGRRQEGAAGPGRAGSAGALRAGRGRRALAASMLCRLVGAGRYQRPGNSAGDRGRDSGAGQVHIKATAGRRRQQSIRCVLCCAVLRVPTCALSLLVFCMDAFNFCKFVRVDLSEPHTSTLATGFEVQGRSWRRCCGRAGTRWHRTS